MHLTWFWLSLHVECLEKTLSLYMILPYLRKPLTWMQVVVEHPHVSPALRIETRKINPLVSWINCVLYYTKYSNHEPQEVTRFSEYESRIPEGLQWAWKHCLSQCWVAQESKQQYFFYHFIVITKILSQVLNDFKSATLNYFQLKDLSNNIN